MTRKTSRSAALAAILVTATAAASPQATPIPGGTLDPRFPGAEIYLTSPTAAKPGARKACKVAQRYVDLVNAGRYRDVAALYAADALLLEPMRSTTRDSMDIKAFYEGKIGPIRPEVVPVAYLGDDRDCMVELTTKIDVAGERRFALVSIDHFTLDAHGRILRMIAFARPPRSL